jgi:hypothetical protein
VDHAARQIRLRHADLIDAVERLDQGGGGADTAVVQTTTVSTYPVTAAASYAVVPVQLGGAETEGAAATVAADSSRVFFALNLGSAIPPSGTNLICFSAGGRWSFRYDG